MCMSTALSRPLKPATVNHAELHQENVGSKDSMGASGHRDQGWEKGKHVDNAGEERICQPDNRVIRHGMSNATRIIRLTPY